ncbi:MAG TPA: DnaJ domain-containing protein [Polyangiaceae bacterium]|jgi:tetratricopeptide (TPR) repeat protein
MGDHTNSRPPPTANGTLAKTPFVHLLVYARDKKLGGTMELFAPDKRSAVILFSGGEPVKVRTSEPVAYLGQVLHELQLLDEQELSRSLAELAKRKQAGHTLHGALLLERKAIDLAKLHEGLAEQIGRKLHHVAGMPGETAYAYYDGFDVLRSWGGDDSAPVDAVPFMWGMVREHASAEHVDATLARTSKATLRLAEGAVLARLRLGKDEAAAAQALRSRPLSTGELAKAAKLDERTGQRLAYLLLVTRQVDVVAGPGAVAGSMPPAARVSSPPAMSPPPARPAGAASAAPPPRASALPPPPRGLSPELTQRWKEIVERAATIDRADYFMMLDLARDATHEDVEDAFFALAKRWHPDRLPAELAPVRDACSRVFARMSEARSTLGDEEQRARYMKLLSEGSGSPETQDAVAKVIEAAQNFQKAEVFLKRSDHAQAESHCRLAWEGDPTQPDYLAMLAWLVASKPENQARDKTMESIRMLDKAVSLSARCERAFYWRGLLYKRLGKADLAAKDFRRAMDLNPRNIDAAREVRLHTMRGARGSTPPPPRATPGGPKGEDGPKGGLFGRLFKK